MPEEEIVGELLAEEDIILEHMDEVQIPKGMKKCEKCGFSFSPQFLEETDGKLLCAACV